jgi:hypothetical protein
VIRQKHLVGKASAFGLKGTIHPQKRIRIIKHSDPAWPIAHRQFSKNRCSAINYKQRSAKNGHNT